MQVTLPSRAMQHVPALRSAIATVLRRRRVQLIVIGTALLVAPLYILSLATLSSSSQPSRSETMSKSTAGDVQATSTSPAAEPPANATNQPTVSSSENESTTHVSVTSSAGTHTSVTVNGATTTLPSGGTVTKTVTTEGGHTDVDMSTDSASVG